MQANSSVADLMPGLELVAIDTNLHWPRVRNSLSITVVQLPHPLCPFSSPMIFRVLSLLPLVLLPPRYAGKGFKFVRFNLALTLGVRGHLGSIFSLRTILSRAFSRPRGG